VVARFDLPTGSFHHQTMPRMAPPVDAVFPPGALIEGGRGVIQNSILRIEDLELQPEVVELDQPRGDLGARRFQTFTGSLESAWIELGVEEEVEDS